MPYGIHSDGHGGRQTYAAAYDLDGGNPDSAPHNSSHRCST